jgi:hypothetical protein
MGDMGGWYGHWSGLARSARAAGLEMTEELGLGELFGDFRRNEFLQRLEVAALALCHGNVPPDQDRLAWELRQYLDEHRALTATHAEMLTSSVVGAPVRPGPTYSRLLAALHWTVQPWAPEAWEAPEGYFFPLLRVAQQLLPRF